MWSNFSILYDYDLISYTCTVAAEQYYVLLLNLGDCWLGRYISRFCVDIQHPDLSDIPLPAKEKKWQGYYKIARHYKWALNQVFRKLNHSAVIIVEGKKLDWLSFLTF